MSASTLGTDSIRDVAELHGISNLNEEVARAVALDLEYRMHEILQEAMKFMKHCRRTYLSTDDVDAALKTLNIEPLYGFGSHGLAQPVEFQEVSMASGKPPIYYIDNEELDLEKIINTPLPRVARDITYTAHWLSIEGVQPSTPQNPTTQPAYDNSKSKASTVASSNKSKSSSVLQFLDRNTRQANPEDIVPPVKQVISKELQLYFEKLITAIFDESKDKLRFAAIQSLRVDPGLHQLLPYLVHFINKKVSEDLRNSFVLKTTIKMLFAILENPHLFIEPYVHQIMAPILTCMCAVSLGSPSDPDGHYEIREEAASLMGLVCRRFDQAYQTLRPRVTLTLLKAFLNNKRPLATHYGAILGFKQLGSDAVRYLLLPNVKIYCSYLQSQASNEQMKEQIERNFREIFETLKVLKDDLSSLPDVEINEQQEQQKLVKLIGEQMTARIIAENDPVWIHSLLLTDSLKKSNN